MEEILEGAEVKRGKGRPKGAKNLPVRFRNWQPTKWKLDYETMLLLHVSGKTNIEIGKTMGYSEVQVGKILLSNMAQDRIDEIRLRLKRRGREIGERMNEIMDKSVDRLHDFIHNDMIFTNSPIMSVDRAMKAMEMIDDRLRVNEGKVTNNTLILATESNVGRLMDAMAMANRAKELNNGGSIPTAGYSVTGVTSDPG